jgi:hypothetical protein
VTIPSKLGSRKYLRALITHGLISAYGTFSHKLCMRQTFVTCDCLPRRGNRTLAQILVTCLATNCWLKWHESKECPTSNLVLQFRLAAALPRLLYSGCFSDKHLLCLPVA